MKERKPYTHVRLLPNEDDPLDRYEVRVSHYIEWTTLNGMKTLEDALPLESHRRRKRWK
jgi:hypothetical protein